MAQRTVSENKTKKVAKTIKRFCTSHFMGDEYFTQIFLSIICKMEKCDVEFPEDLPNIFPKTGRKRVRSHPTDILLSEREMWMPSFGPDSDHFYRVIYSDMQTKKTTIMATVSLIVTLYLRMPVFLFVQNRKADLVQLQQRLTEIFEMWKQYTDFHAEMEILDPERGKFANQDTIRSAMRAGIAKVFVCLFSSTDIDPIVEMTANDELRRYVIILDEADHLDNGSVKGVAESFKELCKHASFVQNVTATPLTTLSHRKCLRRHFIVMSPPVNYKGLCQVSWKDLGFRSEPCNKIDDDPFEKDPNMIPFLIRFHANEYVPTHSVSGEKVPRYLLMRFGKTIEPQLTVARYIHTNYPNTVAITWNGGEKGTTMRCKLLPQESIHLPNSRIFSEYKDGVHYFHSVHIGKLISFLHLHRFNRNGTLRFKRIVVLAGVMADRGITFGADNYTECKESRAPWWHLTDLYYIGSKNKTPQNLANVLQACGRICGVYEDNIHLSLYSNWVDGIREGYKLEQELIDRVQSIGDRDENILEALPDMKVTKGKKPKKMRLTNDHVKEPVEWIKESDVEFGGWTDEKRDSVIEGTRTYEDPEMKDEKGGIYIVDPNTLTKAKSRDVQAVIDEIIDMGKVNEWVSRADIINRIVQRGAYINNSLRGCLTRIQQKNSRKSEAVGHGLNFRPKVGKEQDWEILYSV